MRHGDEDKHRNPRDRERRGVSRRQVLRSATGTVFAAAGAGLAGAFGGTAEAQVTGTSGGGGTVPLRMPMCAMNELDRNEYIHNVEIHAHLPDVPGGVGTDGVTSPLWVRGSQRMLQSGLDITDPKKPVMALEQSMPRGNLAYVKSLKKWIVLGSSGPGLTAPTPEFPRGKYHQEYARRVINSTRLRGIRTFDATDPANPNLLQEFSTGETGSGAHANFWDGGRYAFLDCGWDNQLRMESSERPFSNALMIVDMADPANVKEVSRWWVPGQRYGEEEEYRKWPFAGDESSWTCAHGGVVPRRPEDGGNVCFWGMGHFGMYSLDISDIARPTVMGRVSHPLEAMGGIPYHSLYPTEAGPSQAHLQDLIIGVFESLETDCREPWHTSYVINVSDPSNPKIVGLFPRPVPPLEAPYDDFCCARGRFSSHNIQAWAAPGVQKPNIIALTYFNAGLRIYDVSDPTDPKEVAYFVPARDGDLNDWPSWRRQDVSVFIEWDRNLIWCRANSGVYCMSTPLLGEPVLEPRKVERWTVPHINAGWDDDTPSAVFLGRGRSQMA